MTPDRWQEITDLMREESLTGDEWADLAKELWDYIDDFGLEPKVGAAPRG